MTLEKNLGEKMTWYLLVEAAADADGLNKFVGLFADEAIAVAVQETLSVDTDLLRTGIPLVSRRIARPFTEFMIAEFQVNEGLARRIYRNCQILEDDFQGNWKVITREGEIKQFKMGDLENIIYLEPN